MSKTRTEQLAEYVVSLTYDQLPEEVVQMAKMTIMDTIGCGIATVTEDPWKAKVALDIAKQFPGKEEAVTFLGDFKTNSAMAAFNNGVLCHGIDFDDTHQEALTHTSAPVLPAALASAEAEGLSGKDLILSFVLGFEISVRVGMTVMPSHYKYWHSTATNCTFGAAVAAGKNYGLNKEQIINALGLAGAQACGLLTYLEFGDFSKSFNPGSTALTGIIAAASARVGATAPPTMLEHTRGYSYAYCKDEPKLDNLVRDLNKYELMVNAIKPYPSLLASHPAIDAVLKIMIDNDLDSNKIKQITNRVYSTVKSHFSNFNPETTMACRLSVPYCVAVAAVDKAAGLAQFTKKKIFDPKVREMLKKIEIIEDEELNKLYPEHIPAPVIIEMEDGQVFEQVVHDPKGTVRNPFTPDELKDKFRGLVSNSLNSESVEKLIDMLDNLEDVKSVKEITALFNVANK